MSAMPEVASAATPPPLPAVPLRKALGAFALDVLLAVVIGFGLMMAGGMAWGVIEGVRHAMAGATPEELTRVIAQPGALAQLIITMVGMGGAALIMFLWRNFAPRNERSHAWAALSHARTWGWIFGVAIGVFVFSSAMSWLGDRLGIPPNPSNLELIRDAYAQYPVFVGLFAIVIAPAYEEVLFRRVLFGRLWKAGYPVLGMVLSGIVFAFAHEIPGVSGNGPAATLLLLLVYAGMGMAFAWVYRRTGTLWASILAHGLNNAVALALMHVSAA